MDPASIDVNIHPTKAEIKFEDDQLLFQTVFAAVKEAMGREGVAGAIDFDNPEAREMPVIGPRFQEYRPAEIPGAGVDLNYDPFAEVHSPDVPFSRSVQGYVDKTPNYGALFEDRTLPTAQILVVQGRYIFTQSASGLMIVHIRRAWERIFHDRFLKALTAGTHVSQAALFPVQVTVGVEGRLTLDAHAEQLGKLGFDLAPFGPDTVVVNGVPEGYSAQPGQVETLIGDMLLILADEGGSAALAGLMEASMAQKFAVLAASGAARISSPLEAQRLVDSLLQSENPEFTSTGKRIISLVPADEIEKRF